MSGSQKFAVIYRLRVYQHLAHQKQYCQSLLHHRQRASFFPLVHSYLLFRLEKQVLCSSIAVAPFRQLVQQQHKVLPLRIAFYHPDHNTRLVEFLSLRWFPIKRPLKVGESRNYLLLMHPLIKLLVNFLSHQMSNHIHHNNWINSKHFVDLLGEK